MKEFVRNRDRRTDGQTDGERGKEYMYIEALLDVTHVSLISVVSWREMFGLMNNSASSHSTPSGSGTGCSLNIMFFSKILKYSELFPFSVFPRCQCVNTTRQVEHQRCSRTGRVQKNHKF